MPPATLFEKLWSSHVVADLGDGWSLLHIDRILLHDLSGADALEQLASRDLAVAHPALGFATPDHAVPSGPARRIRDPDQLRRQSQRPGHKLLRPWRGWPGHRACHGAAACHHASRRHADLRRQPHLHQWPRTRRPKSRAALRSARSQRHRVKARPGALPGADNR
jgi:hypothetical protein